MKKTFSMCVLALGLAIAGAGCKKKNESAGTASGSAGSGSAMTGGSGSAGGTMAGSGTMTGSATATGSGTMAGSGAMGGGTMAGSGGGTMAGRPPGISDELVALNTKVADIAKATVAELTAANGDCGKMAKTLDGATTKLKPETEKLGAMLDKLDETAQAYYGDNMVGELAAAFGAMDPVLTKCKDDAGVQTAAKNYLTVLVGSEE